MDHKIFLILASCALPLLVRAGETPPAAENPAGTLTLRQALRLTVLQNPELAAADTEIRASEGRLLQAGMSPNPSLFTEVENLIGSGPYQRSAQSESTVQLSQLIELGGKRAARVGVARQSRELAGFDYEGKRLDILLGTTRAFIQALAAQRRRTLADETARLAADLVPAIQRRVDAGAANAVEVTRANNAVATARIDAQGATRDLATTRQRLAAGWGASTARFVSLAGDLEALPTAPPLPALSAGLEDNPAVARFAAEAAQRRAELTQARAAAVPDVTVAVGPRYLAETGNGTVRLNVSLPLPLFDRNQGNLRAARAELTRTDQLRQAAANGLTLSLNESHRALVTTRQEIDTLRTTLLPGAENALRQIDEGYAAGRYGLLDVLDARRTLVGARLQLLNAQTAYHVALGEVEALTGRVRQAPAPATPSRPKTASTRR